ncbi:MAG: 7-cyano-7-deazaguanine synthase [Nitrospirales bacterium]|nr:7-cyano-7-deazaguanine synthase [Nitrospirales bacterium]
MVKAIALYSGGLDSTLAILVAMRQGIEVTAVTFLTHFGCDISDRSSCSKDPFAAAEQFGFEVKLCHLAGKFTEIVINPKFGHGRNMNPCIDCRILMLREAKELMKMRGADFVITGEVLGQRPMSQRRDTFPRIDRESELAGYILRPLSAKLLKPTVPEQQGLVDRERLCAFNGRSRKPQMALARELGLREYPAPAGGCLLTDPLYSYRLKELLAHTPAPSLTEINLLRVGRHFRLSAARKAIVGRDEADNNALLSLAADGEYRFWVEGYGSPLTILGGAATEEELKLAASLCARYSDAKRLPVVEVTVAKNGTRSVMKVAPASKETVDSLMIRPAGT